MTLRMGRKRVFFGQRGPSEGCFRLGGGLEPPSEGSEALPWGGLHPSEGLEDSAAATSTLRMGCRFRVQPSDATYEGRASNGLVHLLEVPR